MRSLGCRLGWWWLSFMALPGVAAAQAGGLEVTILDRVTLPWQAPEVILTASDDVPGPLQVTIRRDGEPPVAEAFESLSAGHTRSVTYAATAGEFDCTVSVTGPGGLSIERTARVVVVPELDLRFGEADVDLEARRLHFRASEAPRFAEISVYDVNGALLHHAETEFEGGRGKHDPRRAYRLRWPELSHHVARIELRVFGEQDTWAEASFAPIDVEVHEPIYFEQRPDGTAVATAGQLDAAHRAALEVLAQHRGAHGLKLYVVAEAPSQQAKLAAHEAREVARYLRSQGKLGVPVRAGVQVAHGGDAQASELRVRTILAAHAPSGFARH